MTVWIIVAVAALLAVPALEAESSLTGSIAGIVSNALGIPQMGASVTLFNRLDRQVARTLTDDKGIFHFESLPADLYNIRVTLASFIPAMRANISVQPGIRRILSINMAVLLSSIELVYSLPVQQGLMSDDWKWALRASLATRPILRILSADARDPLRQMRTGSSLFTHTRGVVKLSAGDATPTPTLGSQPDLGTAFALATSFLGANQLSFSGNVGYSSQSGLPAAGFRTTFSRQLGEGRTPEVAVTMRQIFQSGRAGSALVGGQPDAVPMLRTMSVGVSDRLQLTDNVLLVYGGTLESVTFLDRLNYVSPFAHLAYKLGSIGTLDLGYSSGLPPAQLFLRGSEGDSQPQLNDLALFPRVSLRDGHAHVQRAQNFELGFHKTIGSRTVSAGAYRESLSNAALTAVGADGAFTAGDLLPDLFSTASIFNSGRYHGVGYMTAVQQTFSPGWNATIAYGNSGVLETTRDTLLTDDANELRGIVHTQRRHWASTQVAGVVPGAGTRFTTSYQFMNGRALTPGHYYMTQSMYPAQGLNVHVRQPIPIFSGMPAKLEASAEVRNILAQGYQPISMASGRRLQLVHSPRALRGGLAFIF
ncbi:MAG: carboxypeptidase regulatory-like domain-containing protein [Acidobacteria bacterium]|nr:carboxypeptidase regulatory-like domain-containing protein [Acidobacteriota bacterium]